MMNHLEWICCLPEKCLGCWTENHFTFLILKPSIALWVMKHVNTSHYLNLVTTDITSSTLSLDFSKWELITQWIRLSRSCCCVSVFFCGSTWPLSVFGVPCATHLSRLLSQPDRSSLIILSIFHAGHLFPSLFAPYLMTLCLLSCAGWFFNLLYYLCHFEVPV